MGGTVPVEYDAQTALQRLTTQSWQVEFVDLAWRGGPGMTADMSVGWLRVNEGGPRLLGFLDQGAAHCFIDIPLRALSG